MTQSNRADSYALPGGATRARDEWLEDVIAGLLATGITRDRIAIQAHPGNRTVVAVRGEPRYEYTIAVAGPNKRPMSNQRDDRVRRIRSAITNLWYMQPQMLNTRFGMISRLLREEGDITLEEMAEFLEITPEALARFEADASGASNDGD